MKPALGWAAASSTVGLGLLAGYFFVVPFDVFSGGPLVGGFEILLPGRGPIHWTLPEGGSGR